MTEDQLREHAETIPGSSTAYIADVLRIFCDRIGITIEPPKPVIRPYTPVEAAAHLGRTFRFDGDNLAYKLDATRAGFVESDSSTGRFNYELFSERCQWADDNSPCGVITPASASAPPEVPQ